MDKEARKEVGTSGGVQSGLLLEKLRLLVIRERELAHLRQEYHHHSQWLKCIQEVTVALSALWGSEEMRRNLVNAMVGQFPFEVACVVRHGQLLSAGQTLEELDRELVIEIADEVVKSKEIHVVKPESHHTEGGGTLSWIMGGPLLSHDREEVWFSLIVGRTERTTSYYRLPRDQEKSLFRQLLHAVSQVYAMVSLRGELLGQRDHLADQIEKARIAEQALAAEKERLAVTLESIGDGVITTNVAGEVTSANRAAEAMTGWSEEEALGKQLREVAPLLDEDRRELRSKLISEIVELGELSDDGQDSLLIGRDGTEHFVSLKGAILRGDDKRILGIVVVLRDVSGIRRVHQERLRASKLESVGILAGGIAHDFNNILTAIVSNLSLAVRTISPKDDSVVLLHEAEQACVRAKELTQQLLTFAKGGAPIRRAESISDVIRESSDFALRGSNVRCDATIPDDLSWVDVDAGQISQVIQNLVINADQAMPDGGVLTITAENLTVDGERSSLGLAPGRYVHLAFRDQGVGIPPENLSLVFDPYFTTKEVGTGLGLATSYSVVNRHDGRIAVDSTVGEGTTFHVYLPSSKERTPSPKPLNDAKRGKGRVLVMDDEDGVRRGAERLLTYLGYSVDHAVDGSEALEKYERAVKEGRSYDVVIMDLTIPGGMGGKETIRRLLEAHPNAKVIVSSGYSNDPVMAQYKAHGFIGVLPKPFDLESLGGAVSEALALGLRQITEY